MSQGAMTAPHLSYTGSPATYNYAVISSAMLSYIAMLSYLNAGVRGLVASDWLLPSLEMHIGLRQGDLGFNTSGGMA